MAEYNYTKYTVNLLVNGKYLVLTHSNKWIYRYMGVNDSLWKLFETKDDAQKEIENLKSSIAPMSFKNNFEIGTYIL